MTGHPYDSGAERLSYNINAASIGEQIVWGDDTHSPMYIALMDGTYTQDVTSVHWSEISAYEITPTGNYAAGGQLLTTVAPYIESTLYSGFRFIVYTSNASASPTYSVSWTGQTFTDISGACIYKKGSTAAASPLLCFISELSERDADADKYYILFGAPVATLGIFHRQLF